jgi:LPXTG-motif cell wall-anchored protein
VAEIPIRRKEGRNIWPLLIGLLVVAGALWFLFARPRSPEPAASRADSAAVAAPGVAPRDTAPAGAVTTPPASTPRDTAARP